MSTGEDLAEARRRAGLPSPWSWQTSPASWPACVRRWPAAAAACCCARPPAGERGVVAFIADDKAAAQAVLEGAGIDYLIRPALTVQMDNRPAAAAAALRKLADAPSRLLGAR